NGPARAFQSESGIAAERGALNFGAVRVSPTHTVLSIRAEVDLQGGRMLLRADLERGERYGMARSNQRGPESTRGQAIYQRDSDCRRVPHGALGQRMDVRADSR